MPSMPQPNYHLVELDPAQLSTPFRVQTNWHVITGSPCCGKTTLIDLLAARGYETIPETAHVYIEGERAAGRPVHDTLKDRIALQRILIDRQLTLEGELQAHELIFLDRALPDYLSFSRFVGLDPNEILPECFCHRYASVLILDPLPFKEDGIRDSDAALVGYLDEWLARDYRSLGYRVVRIPVATPEERLAFVLETVSVQG